jgi:hypothetical protein
MKKNKDDKSRLPVSRHQGLVWPVVAEKWVDPRTFTDKYKKCPHGVEFYKPCHDCDPELYDFMMGT